jgi:predicted DNA-binding transcriptional regulator YafY
MSLRLERLLAMDAAIRSGSYPGVATFMRRFEVSERTVRADLTFMRERLSRLSATIEYAVVTTTLFRIGRSRRCARPRANCWPSS